MSPEDLWVPSVPLEGGAIKSGQNLNNRVSSPTEALPASKASALSSAYTSGCGVPRRAQGDVQAPLGNVHPRVKLYGTHSASPSFWPILADTGSPRLGRPRQLLFGLSFERWARRAKLSYGLSKDQGPVGLSRPLRPILRPQTTYKGRVGGTEKKHVRGYPQPGRAPAVLTLGDSVKTLLSL